MSRFRLDIARTLLSEGYYKELFEYIFMREEWKKKNMVVLLQKIPADKIHELTATGLQKPIFVVGGSNE